MGVLRELWTGELINSFRHEGLFLSRIPSADQYVNNNVIHLADIGADPAVLINNTTYPIAVVSRDDDDVTISLNKFDTENTAILDDELYGLPYDKPGSVMEQHREVLEEVTTSKAAHQLAPADNSDANQPVISTTGASDGETNPRKLITVADIRLAKKRLDNLKIPQRDRILVLHPDHIAGLLAASENFAMQYSLNNQEGKVTKLYGFEIFEYGDMPVYTTGGGAVLNKKAFGAAAAPSTDQVSSIFFYAKRAVKARGNVEMYYQDAKTNPEYRQSVVGFRVYHVCIPKKTTGFGAIVSAVHTS